MIFLKTLPLVLLIGLGSCSINPKNFLLTDAATPLAYDIESAALKWEASDKNSTEIKHTPWAYPEGVKGDYNVSLCRSVSVHKYSTSYHCRFVSVPEFLHVEKKTDEPTYLLLQKTDKPWNYTGGGKTLKGNKTIEIISIR